MTGAPTNYLSKTLVALTRAGLVHSARGRSGGFVLAHTPNSISIAQVADVFAEPRSARHCLLGNGPCNVDAPCHAHRRWMRLTSAVRAPLAMTTLADLLRDATDSEATESLPAEMAGIS
jgi:cysteine desulfurase